MGLKGGAFPVMPRFGGPSGRSRVGILGAQEVADGVQDLEGEEEQEKRTRHGPE